MGKSGALPEDVDGRFEFIGIIGGIGNFLYQARRGYADTGKGNAGRGARCVKTYSDRIGS